MLLCLSVGLFVFCLFTSKSNTETWKDGRPPVAV